jgi:hypothetical protein
MFKWLKKIRPFGKKDFSAERHEEYYETKKQALECILGEMDDLVGHALIPFQVGGALDMYYFRKCMPGTVFASMELINPDGKGPKPNRLGTYELITCTRKVTTSAPQESFEEKQKRIKEKRITEFEKIERRMCGIMTMIGYYSFETVLQPGETAELPAGEDRICLIFDKFEINGAAFKIEGKQHGLLLCMELHPSELQYARQQGTKNLIEKLKLAGVYPYSDLDREPVV